jgi:hypothetical protein
MRPSASCSCSACEPAARRADPRVLRRARGAQGAGERDAKPRRSRARGIGGGTMGAGIAVAMLDAGCR